MANKYQAKTFNPKNHTKHGLSDYTKSEIAHHGRVAALFAVVAFLMVAFFITASFDAENMQTALELGGTR